MLGRNKIWSGIGDEVWPLAGCSGRVMDVGHCCHSEVAAAEIDEGGRGCRIWL